MYLGPLLIKFKETASRPLVRGMIAYSILWPSSSLLQQTLEGRRPGNYDWKRCLRYSMYGSLFVAPTLYCWIRLTSAMWPTSNLKTGVIKGVLEQFSYGPFATTCFFVGMSLLESKTLDEAFGELKSKFLPTYKTAICVWPVLQTINFSMVPERNRVVFVSICGVMWTTFLAYMKQLENQEKSELLEGAKQLKIEGISLRTD